APGQFPLARGAAARLDVTNPLGAKNRFLFDSHNTVQLRVLSWQGRIDACAAARRANSPYAEVIVVANLCNVLRLEHIAIANGKAGNSCRAANYSHLEAIGAASLDRKRQCRIRDNIDLRLDILCRRDDRRGDGNRCTASGRLIGAARMASTGAAAGILLYKLG